MGQTALIKVAMSLATILVLNRFAPSIAAAIRG